MAGGDAASSRLNQGSTEGAAATAESRDTGAVGGTEPRSGDVAAQMQQNMLRMVDIKGLAKLVPFSGAEEDWPEWHFRTKALGPLLGLAGIMKIAETAVADPDEEAWNLQDKVASQLLWSILSQTLRGRAYLILRMVPEGHGATVWFRVYQDYQMPKQIPRQMAMLVGLLEPRFGAEIAGFLDKFLSWERRIADLQAHDGIVLPESVRCAVLMTKSPKAIRRFLENQAVIVQTSYSAMRQALQLYLYRNRSFDSEGTTQAMEVDVAERWVPEAESWEDDAEEDDEDEYYTDAADGEEIWVLCKGKGRSKGKGKKQQRQT